MTTTRYSTLDSPIGRLLFVGDGEVIFQLHMEDPRKRPELDRDWIHDAHAFRDGRHQLAAYFGGDLTEFDLNLAAKGTSFQKTVWDALLEIPFGKTAAYSDVARRIGMPSASRAVGSASSRNPIAIVVPCHRVIGASGKLTGYAGGLDRKQKLLDHEMKVVSQIRTSRDQSPAAPTKPSRSSSFTGTTWQ